MNVRRIVAVSLVLAGFVLGAAFAAPDVVATGAVRSFDALLRAPGINTAHDGAQSGWTVRSPGSETLTFGSAGAVALGIDARPFLDAGLDVSLLPGGWRAEGQGASARLVFSVVAETSPRDPGRTPAQALETLIRQHRTMLGFHMALGHFGLSLGGGTMVEWAQDLPGNEKDLVVALNPQTFADAGVDVSRVAGWVLADVPMMDAQGRTSTARKLLRFYNLS
jgi:hypothetical protein